MVDPKPQRAKANRQMAGALSRWEGEGGAQGMRGKQGGTNLLADRERQILECLGAAVVIQWNDLSTEVQRAIFRHAAAVKDSYDPIQLRAHIARFLHDHKDDADGG